MKYYKTEFDMNAPTKGRVTMLANSDYGLAVGLKKNGKKVDLDASDVTLKIGSETISADSTDNGMAVFGLSSGFDGGSVLADVDFDRPGQVLNYYGEKNLNTGNKLQTLLYSVYLSAMTDTPIVGLKPSQVTLFGDYWSNGNARPAKLVEKDARVKMFDGEVGVTRTWVNQDGIWVSLAPTTVSAETLDVPLSAEIIAQASSGTTKGNFHIVTKIDIDQQPADATFKLELAAEDRGAYFKKDGSGGDVPADVATQSWVESQISGFVEDSDLTAYATTDSLTAYATVDSLSSKVSTATTGQAPLISAVNSVYETDWATLSATADANTFYVVLPDPA